MNYGLTLLNAAAAFLLLAVVFGMLERAYPARPGQRILRPEWAVDLLFFLGQYLLWSGLAVAILQRVEGPFARLLPDLLGGRLRTAIASQPMWLRACEVVLLSDFCIYWGHRLQHHSALLWRFHAVHHSAEHLDWLAAHREHPLDGLYTQTIVNLPAFLLGFPVETLAGLAAFRGLWAIFIHSNVRVPLGPFAFLLGAPQLHHWHHARDRFQGNYGNLSPLMDWLFGTYQCPATEPDELGLRERFPRSYLGQLLWPFRPTP